MSKKHGIILLCALVLIAMIALLNKRCKSDNNYDIRIACNVPMTGDLATYGESIRDGMLLAQADLKEQDPSFTMDIDFEDNASKANLALNIFNKQKMGKIDYYISGVKPQTMTIIDGVEKLNIPHFTWIFDAYVTQKYNNAYRCWVNYRVEAEYIKRFVEEKQAKKVALVYVQLPHTDELVNTILIPFLKEKGIEYIVEPYDSGKTDFKDIATKLKSSGIDAVYVNGFKFNLIGIAKAFEDYNINTTCNNLYTYDFMDAKEELNDVITSHINYIVPSYEIDQSQQKKDWQERFTAKFHRAPRYTDAYAYDMTFAIYQSVKENKPIKDITFEGITGKVEFDETGDIVTKLYIINYTNQEIKHVLQEN
jgi:branched-chain amino acid transport system substrate-binding protein